VPDISELPALLDIHSRGRYYLFAQPVGDQRQRSFKQFVPAGCCRCCCIYYLARPFNNSLDLPPRSHTLPYFPSPHLPKCQRTFEPGTACIRRDSDPRSASIGKGQRATHKRVCIVNQ